MEGGDQLIALACSDDVPIHDREDFYLLSYLFYIGSTNEGHWHITYTLERANGMETAQLSAIGVAAHLDVHRTEMFAIQQDQSGTGAEYRHSFDYGLPYRFEQRLIADDAHHGCTLATRDDEFALTRRDIGQILLPILQIPDQDTFYIYLLEPLLMFSKGSL